MLVPNSEILIPVNPEKSLMEKLEMCQYDTDAPTQGHPHPHAGILQKMKLKKEP